MVSNEKMIEALLNAPSVTAAAQQLGVDRGSICRRLRKPEFRAAYDLARRDALDGATGQLLGRLGSAVDIVYQIAQDTENSPQIRLNACAILIQNALRFNEQTALSERMTAIENRLNENEKGL